MRAQTDQYFARVLHVIRMHYGIYSARRIVYIIENSRIE